MNDLTLKSALNRIILVTLTLVGLVATGLIFSYSQIKQSLSIRALEESINRDSAVQVEALLPSFLVPEQRAGMSVLLDRFKVIDNLDEIRVFNRHSELPHGFDECKLGATASSCLSRDRKDLATITPISVSDHSFGYLLKVKKIPNFFENDHLVILIESMTGVAILFFLLLFLFLGRLTSYELPSDLRNLEIWVEKVLHDEAPAGMPALKFKEMKELGDKITEIIKRHEKLRDQAMIGQLTSGIMHDIRNPLQPLVTAYQLVEEQSQDSVKRLSRLENLYRVCKSKLPLIGEIIESTLDGNREISICPELTDLRTTVSQSAANQLGGLKKKDIILELDLGSSPVFIHHDAVQMGRVFSNLIRNSIESIESNLDSSGTVPATIKIGLTVCPSKNYIRAVFEDSGTGLPDNAESVFRLFRSNKPRGTGLGLVVSRKIVEAHNGKLTPQNSEVLPGARFDVLLPISNSMMKGVA